MSSNIEVLNLCYVWLIAWKTIFPSKKTSIPNLTTCGNEKHRCNTLSSDVRAGQLALAWWRVPRKTWSRLVSKGLECIGNVKM
jgi:hypothetical protein